MKKFFTLLAVAAMAFGAQANEITVADGSATNAHVPFYALYYDTQGTQSQVIYPDYLLTDMVGSQITELKFYVSNGSIALRGGMLDVYMKVVDENEFTMAKAVALTEDDLCAQCAPQNGATEFVITLDEPFQYNGGNLLLGTVVTTTGNYATVYFYGESTGLYGSLYEYEGYYGGKSAYTEAFLPKTTFTFEAGQAPVVPTEKTDAPSSAKNNFVYNDGNLYYNAYTVTLNETEESTIYYRIGIMAEDGQYEYGEWMEYEDAMQFVVPGTYMVEAYAVAPGKAESDHIFDGFVVSRLTDVEEIMAGKQVANVRYFNLAGQEMQQASGLTIQVTTYTDGTTSAVKVVK